MLDTNVLSELMRKEASSIVLDWMDSCPAGDQFICAINIGEITRGLELMPDGKRKLARRVIAEGIFDSFAGRCLAFGDAAAIAFGYISAMRIRSGRPISTEDAQIAAIALVHGMRLATRNTRDFEGIEGLETVNPWAA